MTNLNPITSGMIPALNILKANALPPTMTIDTPRLLDRNTIAFAGRPPLSPSVQQALSEINRIIHGQYDKSPSTIEHIRPDHRLRETIDLGNGFLKGPAQTLDELSEYERDQVLSFGINPKWVRRVVPVEISDEKFHQMVMDHFTASRADDEAFMAALKDGNLTIQRSKDVPELGEKYGSISFSYHDNIGYGNVVFSNEINCSPIRAEKAAQGIRLSTGSLMGHGFYVTWPDESLKV